MYTNADKARANTNIFAIVKATFIVPEFLQF